MHLAARKRNFNFILKLSEFFFLAEIGEFFEIEIKEENNFFYHFLIPKSSFVASSPSFLRTEKWYLAGP